jgi:hypothetical protein
LETKRDRPPGAGGTGCGHGHRHRGPAGLSPCGPSHAAHANANPIPHPTPYPMPTPTPTPTPCDPTHHTLSGLYVCRERALKSAGERNTHGGAGAGTPRKPPAPARGTLGVSTPDIQRRLGGGGSPLPAMLTALLGERRRFAARRARCAHAVSPTPSGP